MVSGEIIVSMDGIGMSSLSSFTNWATSHSEEHYYSLIHFLNERKKRLCPRLESTVNEGVRPVAIPSCQFANYDESLKDILYVYCT
jgi:hypothetical protein